jgi:predicted HD phosphohydrolase
MGPEEAAEFRANPFASEALAVRRCDERAKVAGLKTETLEQYRDLLESQILGNQCVQF